jgi:hypothetical protein
MLEMSARRVSWNVCARGGTAARMESARLKSIETKSANQSSDICHSKITTLNIVGKCDIRKFNHTASAVLKEKAFQFYTCML